MTTTPSRSSACALCERPIDTEFMHLTIDVPSDVPGHIAPDGGGYGARVRLCRPCGIRYQSSARFRRKADRTLKRLAREFVSLQIATGAAPDPHQVKKEALRRRLIEMGLIVGGD